MNSRRQHRKPRKPHAVRAEAAAAGTSCPAADGGDFIEETIATWQPLTGRRLTREDGRQIAENVSGFFSILAEWDRAERNAEKAARPRRPKQPDDRPAAVMKEANESTSTLAAPQQAAPL